MRLPKTSLVDALPEPLPDSLPDPVETAAWFAVSQPGWVERVVSRHIRGDSGLCLGCGIARPTLWPCVLIYIASRAVQIDQARGLAWRAPQIGGYGPVSAATRETPAAYSASSVA
jgi:hypothetical protein